MGSLFVDSNGEGIVDGNGIARLTAVESRVKSNTVVNMGILRTVRV